MSIQFRQLGEKERLDSVNLKTIAELIYETDSYIYPAMFSSLENAVAIIPEMIRLDDKMFRCKNLFIAEENGSICGIILWIKGSLDWNAEIFERCAQMCKTRVSQHLLEVKECYLSSYYTTPKDTTSILNICVRKTYRGRGIGTKMLGAFLEQNSSPFELFVLKENVMAIKSYKSCGFVITEQIDGFSLQESKPPCYKMELFG
ncbi:MAG: GNAT family N-acetyltransferase [Lachnospiraceae bacterium]|nr:GNAT family N-acetyltransferase [Lachnospiraceae bacterium]